MLIRGNVRFCAGCNFELNIEVSFQVCVLHSPVFLFSRDKQTWDGMKYHSSISDAVRQMHRDANLMLSVTLGLARAC